VRQRRFRDSKYHLPSLPPRYLLLTGLEVTDDHDPRETFEFPALNFSSTRSPPPRPPVDGDSDPEEDDIDSFSRDTAGHPSPYRTRRQAGGNSEDILTRFTEMLMNDLGGSRPPNRATHSPLFPPGAPREDARTGGQASGPTPAESMNPFWGFPPPGAPGTVQRTTFRSGPSGSTTYTIVSSSSVQTGSGANFASPFPAYVDKSPPSYDCLCYFDSRLLTSLS